MQIINEADVALKSTHNFYLKKEIDALKIGQAIFIKTEDWKYKTLITMYYHIYEVTRHCKSRNYKLKVRKCEGGWMIIKKVL